MSRRLALLAAQFVVGLNDGVSQVPRKAASTLSTRKITNHALRTVQLLSQLHLRKTGLQQVSNHLLPVHFFHLEKSHQPASYRPCDIYAIAYAVFICITIAI
jgi:hypothetical protein